MDNIKIKLTENISVDAKDYSEVVDLIGTLIAKCIVILDDYQGEEGNLAFVRLFSMATKDATLEVMKEFNEDDISEEEIKEMQDLVDESMFKQFGDAAVI